MLACFFFLNLGTSMDIISQKVAQEIKLSRSNGSQPLGKGKPT